ncbi:MAG: thrombospondin type 3 repeat-containing protein [Verrucomicrobia bacterium]|nr:thrombospondin type 3 repeat-containing protein [Verrucomicrobiota bacterium]
MKTSHTLKMLALSAFALAIPLQTPCQAWPTWKEAWGVCCTIAGAGTVEVGVGVALIGVQAAIFTGIAVAPGGDGGTPPEFIGPGPVQPSASVLEAMRALVPPDVKPSGTPAQMVYIEKCNAVLAIARNLHGATNPTEINLYLHQMAVALEEAAVAYDAAGLSQTLSQPDIEAFKHDCADGVGPEREDNYFSSCGLTQIQKQTLTLHLSAEPLTLSGPAVSVSTMLHSAAQLFALYGPGCAGSIFYGGQSHCPLGAAALTPVAEHLLVSGLGSSGQDGVSVALIPSQAFTTSTGADPAAPVGSYMTSNFYAPGADGSSVPAGVVGMRRVAKGFTAIVDFSTLGSPTYTAKVFNHGTPVASASGLTGEAVGFTFASPGRWDCTCNWNWPFSWTWTYTPSSGSAAVAFTIAGTGGGVPVFGDEIRFTADVVSAPQAQPTRVDILGGNMPEFTILSEAVRVRGLEHTGLGGAAMSVAQTTGNLDVAGLGSSGQDGIAVALTNARTWGAHWQPLDPTDALPVGAAVRSEIHGTAGTVANGLLGFWNLAKTGPGNYEVSADFSGMGAATVTLQLYSGENLVVAVPGLSGVLGFINGCVDDDHWGNPTPSGPSGLPGPWGGALTFLDPRLFVFPPSGGGLPGYVVCDRIVVLPEGGPAVSSLSKATVTTVGIPQISIDQEHHGLYYAGLFHESLGQAGLKVENEQLTASGLGSSGQDGVSVALIPSQAFTTSTNADPAAPLGSYMVSKAFAPGTGGASTPTEVVGMRRVGTGFTAIVDFSGLGSPTYTAKVFDHGTLVGAGGGLTGEVVSFFMARGYGISCTRDEKTKCWSWRIELPNPFESASAVFNVPGSGGVPLVGDQILFIPDAVPAGQAQPNRVDIVGANMPQITLLGESVRLRGLDHTGLGEAALAVVQTTGELALGGLGSSGQDGVSVHLGAAGFGTLGMQPGIAASRVDGSFFEITTVGNFNGADKVPMLVGRVEDVGSQYALSARYFAGMSARGLRVEVFNGEALAASQELPFPAAGTSTGPLVLFPDCPWRFDWWWWLVDELGALQSIVSSEMPVMINLVGRPPVMGNKIVISALSPTGQFGHVSDLEVRSAGLSGMTVYDEPLGLFHHAHRAVNQAAITADAGHVIVSSLGSSGQDGVSVALGQAASCDYSWLPLDLHQPSPIGASVQTAFTGSVNGVPDQSLGYARVTRANSGTNGYELSADLTPLGSPTLRVEVWNSDVLVAVFPGTPGGIFGGSSRWPIGGGKTGRWSGGWVLGCIKFDYPDLTDFMIKGAQVSGNKLLMLQESPPVANYLSGYTITGTGLSGASADTSGFTLTGETATPLASPASFGRLRVTCTYQLIPPKIVWVFGTSATTADRTVAGALYHLQAAVQVPLGVVDLMLSVVNSHGVPVPFGPSPEVAAKVRGLHPAAAGYGWVGFQSVAAFDGGTTGSIAVYQSNVSFQTADPAATTGATWFGSDAPADSGLPSGEAYTAFDSGPSLDTDGDSLPDSWELSYGLNLNDATDAQSDLDGDGLSNAQEYLAGTNPASASSVLKLDLVNMSATGMHYQFQATAGTPYQLEESSTLTSWTIRQVLPAQSVTHIVDLVLPFDDQAPSKFWRIITQ